MSGPGGPVVCDVAAITDPDEEAVEALARLQLAVTRAGATLELARAGRELRDLLALLGLDDVLRCACPPRRSGVEVDRHLEQREQVGVDEEVDPGDHAV